MAEFIDQSYKIIEQRSGIDGMYLQIEQAGRTCYQSIGTRYFMIPEDPIQEEKSQVDNIVATWLLYGKGYAGHINVGLKQLCLSIKNSDVKMYPDYITQYEITEDKAMEIESFNGGEYRWLLDPDYEPIFKNLTARDFADKVLKKNGHGAMLEHGTVYLDIPCFKLGTFFRYAFNKYSRCKFYWNRFLITTNYRVVSEKKAEKDLNWFATDTTNHYKRPCVRFVMDRVGSQSVERHRGWFGISFAQESTRFCNYSNEGKFGEMKFIIPRWMYALRDKLATFVDSLDHTSNEWMLDYEGPKMVQMLECHDRSVSAYCDACRRAEEDYNFLCTSEESEQLKPQDARGILPLQVKTEFVMTAFEIDWKHFFFLRDESHAHPDIQYIAHKLHKEEPFKNL